ncbi:MAG: hypothetical protein Q9188_003673, partial [Gyalolechia gomerana]
MTVHTDYLKEEKENGNGNGNLKNETLLTLFLTSFLTSNTSSPTDAPIIKSGPVFTLITYNTTSTSTNGKGSGDDKLGEKAGVPVGLGIFLIAAAGLVFWFLRRRRNRQAG